jgi:thymidylate synthase
MAQLEQKIDQITEIIATLKPIRTAAMLVSAWNPQFCQTPPKILQKILKTEK